MEEDELADIEKIIDKAVNGDSNACNELYKLSCRWVYFTCYEILKNEKDAEDITQETYLTALQKLSGLKERKYFRSWICKIAINKCRKFLIKNGSAILEEEPQETDNELPDEEIILPDEYVENEEKRAIIMNIITNSLSDVQRQTIILYYYNQLTVAEIAEEMDCPVGTVTYRLSSAKKIIRKEVLRYEETNNESLRLTVPVPLLTRLLNAEADNHPLPDSDILKFALPSPLKTLPTVPDISLASTLTSTVTKILSAKSLAVISSVVIGGGGLGYYFYDSNNSENFTDVISEEKISSATENTIASDNFIFTQNTERVSSDTVNTAVVSATEKTSLTTSSDYDNTNSLTSGTMALVTKPSFLTTSAETTSTKTTSSAVSIASSVKTTVTSTTKTLTTAKTKTTTVSLTETAVNTTSAVTSATATTTAVTEVLSEAVTTVLPLNASYAGEKIDISYGFSHKAYIDLDGTLYMSGSNENGQLGDGTTEDRTEAVAVMEDVSFKSVSLGKYHSAAIAEDGSLYMWGLNTSGQLGNGTTENSSVPLKIMENVKSVSLYGSNTIAVTEDGTLYRWGLIADPTNTYSNEYDYTPVKVMDNVTYADASGTAYAVITDEGKLYYWGDNYESIINGSAYSEDKWIDEPQPILEDLTFVAVSQDDQVTAALADNGDLYMWGLNTYGNLGINASYSFEPVKVMENVQQFSIGNSHSGAITTDGSLYTWGNNSYGQLGADVGNTSRTPVHVMEGTKFSALRLSFRHTSAITEDNIEYYWGMSETQ